MASRVHNKIKKLEDLRQLVPKLKKSKKKIVLCHGVFDLLHLGHIRYLNSAKKYGDILIVTATADKFVKRGPGRPIFKQDLRAETLANLAVVDYVAIIEHPTAVECIRAVRPDFYVKGPDYSNRGKDLTGKIFDEEKAVEQGGGKLVFTDDITFSSSQLINLYLDSYPEQVTKQLKKLSAKYSMEDISVALNKMSKLKILVIGDTIIDQYHYCEPLGKSAKEIIVANKFLSDENFAGGALATANHVAQVSDSVTLLTVLGERDSFEEFIRERLDSRIKPKIFSRPGCVTTVKKRYVNFESNRKLFEIVYLDDHLLSGKQEKNILSYLRKQLPKFDLVIVSDFGHGLMTDEIIKLLCSKSNCLALNVQTNSANMGFNLVTKFKRADFVCIDQQELRLATGKKYQEPAGLLKSIQKKMKCKQIIATRGLHGSMSYSPRYGIHVTPAFANKTIDTVGAGDAFYAYAAPCFAVGMEPDLLGFIGNAVGSLKVQIVGNREPVKSVDLMKFMARLLKV